MSARSRRLALAVAMFVPALASAQKLSYSPGTSQYRVTTKTVGSQEAMGQKQEFESSSNQLLTIAVSRAHADTLAMTATIDSVQAVGPMGMTPPGLQEMVGFTVMAKLSPFGAVYSATGSNDSLPNAEQLTDEMSRLLPRLRGDMRAGARWTDTTSSTAKQMGLDIKREVITTFTVQGDTTVAGQQSWNVARESAVTMSGSGTSQGQAMTLDGTANVTGNIVVGRNGVFLGSTSKDDVNLTIVLVANGMEIGVVQNAETRIERVPNR